MELFFQITKIKKSIQKKYNTNIFKYVHTPNNIYCSESSLNFLRRHSIKSVTS